MVIRNATARVPILVPVGKVENSLVLLEAVVALVSNHLPSYKSYMVWTPYCSFYDSSGSQIRDVENEKWA